MRAEFEIGETKIKVHTSPDKVPSKVELIIVRLGVGTSIYLSQTDARAVASAIMGAAAELRPRKE
jgi:hypothetical protein